MEVRFNYEDYYSPNFIDPLYRPYILPQEDKSFIYFRKSNSDYPCPLDYLSNGIDYCIKEKKYIKIIPEKINYYLTSRYINIDFYKSSQSNGL